MLDDLVDELFLGPEMMLERRMADAHLLGHAAQRHARDPVVEHVLADRIEQLAAAMLVAQGPSVDLFGHLRGPYTVSGTTWTAGPTARDGRSQPRPAHGL